MFRKIVVVVRGADPEQRAVRRAALCTTRITEVALLDIVHEPMLDGYMGNSAIYEPLRARVVAERAEQMKELVAALRGRGLDVTGKAVWDHPLDEAVAKEVRAQSADLAVIAPVDASGLSQSEWRLVSTCPAPVLVVKAAPAGKYRHIIAAVDPFHSHAKPTELDHAILARARDLQADTGATLSALHCFMPYEYFSADLTRPTSHTSGADFRREQVEALLKKSELDASAGRLEIGATHDVLKRLAERGEADVIVMGALARGRLKDWLIGNTAERVLHGADVDVLAVKPGHLR